MKNYLIIGGSTGIGLASSVLLSSLGHTVFSSYNKTTTESNNINYFHYDVNAPSTDFGFLPEIIDGLVYCPGKINLKPFTRIKAEDILEDIQLQVIGAFNIIQAVLPKLKKSDSASIVLFSTVAVQTGFPFHSLVSISKGAIEGLVKALAAEFAPNIRVNCIAPSITDTPLASGLLNTQDKKDANALRHPLKKIGSPDDLAHSVEFLLSSKSSWMTGQVLHIDGGISNLKV